MRSSTTSGHKTPTTTHTYSPSVPLSVYRELAAELQAAEAMLDSCNAQNQHLAKQNQQLRQEISKPFSPFYYSRLLIRLGQLTIRIKIILPRISGLNPVVLYQVHVQSSGVPTAFNNQGLKVHPLSNKGSWFSFFRKVFTEQQEGRYRRRSQPESASQMSSWSLAIAIY